jgi:pyruvate dehydrogenase E1 component alpha subunit
MGLGYEMPCGPVDGMNPVKVAMTEAIERARRGDGPTFHENLPLQRTFHV